MKDNSSPTLSIFANIFINNEERLKRMKDSFKSFHTVNSNQWVVNIRGKYKIDAGEYLRNELGKKLHLSYINSGFGWLHVSRKISKKINADYVFSWIEDHILLAPKDILEKCINEMKQFNVDILCYTWYIPIIMDPFKIVDSYGSGKYINAVKIDNKASTKIIDYIKKRKKNLGISNKYDDFYVISGSSIIKKDFFIKALKSKKPYLKRKPRKTPHDFEKRSKDKFAKEILTAWPNQELFACIDDDLGTPGYSLISRGIYPNRVSRDNLLNTEDKPNPLRKKIKKLIPKFLRPLIIFIVRYIYRIIWTLNLFWNK